MCLIIAIADGFFFFFFSNFFSNMWLLMCCDKTYGSIVQHAFLLLAGCLSTPQISHTLWPHPYIPAWFPLTIHVYYIPEITLNFSFFSTKHASSTLDQPFSPPEKPFPSFVTGDLCLILQNLFKIYHIMWNFPDTLGLFKPVSLRMPSLYPSSSFLAFLTQDTSLEHIPNCYVFPYADAYLMCYVWRKTLYA